MKKLNVSSILFSRASLCITILFLSFAFVPTIAAQCGNGILDTGEECDDGNTLNGDCCDADCNFEPFGSPCGDPSDTDCTDPDNCTGDGYCSPRHASGGTPCGDPSDTDCTDPDNCTGDGNCSPRHAPGGTPCTDDGNVCTDDECSGAGTCLHINNTIPCNDDLFCNGTDSCSDGICSVHTGDPCPPQLCDEGLDICYNLDSDTMCKGNFDFDQDVDGGDAFVFKTHFGRSAFKNPCPPDGPAPTEKTGQTTSYAAGDDGDIEKGITWPNPRFTDNEDGTVTDNLTGLIWLKDADCFGIRSWDNALSDCNALANGMCGLTDGSSAGDWRLPNHKELVSLTHDAYYDPALPDTTGTEQWSQGDPFNAVQSDDYWSSTTFVLNNSYALSVWMYIGYTQMFDKTSVLYVWPVRGGH